MKLILSDRPVSLFIENSSIKFVDLSSLRISNCIGCFGCWTKTPGKCVIRDDAVSVYPAIAQSKEVIYISRVCYGGYDTIMKTMLERSIPVQQAFIRLLHGETHHVQRRVAMKKATVMAYGVTDEEEKELFRNLIMRNASNMNFKEYKILFVEEEDLETVLKKEIRGWGK